MDKSVLMNQLDWIQARMEDMDKLIINYDPEKKGYEEALKNLNHLTDRYNELLDEIEHFDDPDIESEKLKIEAEKIKINQEIEQDKINLESERIRLDRDKFAFDVEQAKKKEVIDIIFRTGELSAKIIVPILGFMSVRYVANLSYMNDEEMKLCNGRIAGTVKDVMKILMMKV